VSSVEVKEVAGYAIVIQGMIENDTSGMAAHQKTTRLIYQTLKQRGFDDNDIKYFDYNTGEPSDKITIDGIPSTEILKDAIINWASSRMNTNAAPLYIILVDHGHLYQDLFYLPSENLNSTTLSAWVTSLQDKLNENASKQHILIALGFCNSGSFVENLSGNNRLIIASTSIGESSYRGPKDDDGIRQGEFFLAEFFKYAAMPLSIKQSFVQASTKTKTFTASFPGNLLTPYQALQNPMIISNDQLDNRFLGIDKANQQEEINHLFITEVSESQFLTSQENASLTFWAKVNNNNWLDKVWIEIKSPDVSITHTEHPGQSILALEKIDGTFMANQYQWNNIQGFNQPGTYQILYFARDNKGAVSPLKETRVYVAKPGNLSPQPFSLIYPKLGDSVGTKTLLDWEDSSDKDSQFTYTVILSESNSEFITPITIETLTESHYIFSNNDRLNDFSQYYWKVLAIDQLPLPSGSYTLFAFIDHLNSGITGQPDCLEPSGEYQVHFENSTVTCEMLLCKKGDINNNHLSIALLFQLFDHLKGPLKTNYLRCRFGTKKNLL